jgi:hypothetical protein
MNKEFHPGYLPLANAPLTSPSKKKKKPSLRKSNPTVYKRNAVIPVHHIDPKYQIEYAMQSFSIKKMYKNTTDRLQLLLFYSGKPILQPYIETVKEATIRLQMWDKQNQRLKTIFSRFLQLWLYKRYKTRFINSVDVVTLDIPKKPIYIYDAKAKGVYQYEASTLKRSIDADLSFTEWLFPAPKVPRNAWTNCSFTIMQLLSIMKQMYAYEMTSTFLEAFKKVKWDLKVYIETYRVPIKLEGLQSMMRNTTSEEYTTLLTEFIEDEYEHHEIEFISQLTILKWAVFHRHSDMYMQRWSKIFQEYTHMCILNGSRILSRIDPLFDTLHNETYTLLRENKEIARLGRERLLANPRRV